MRDGDLVVLGVLPVGDALCTTNPENGWGASMGLTFAFAACEAISGGSNDLAGLARRYHAAVAAEANSVFVESANSDRIRNYRWRGMPIPENERDEEKRQRLLEEGVRQGMLRDPVSGAPSCAVSI